MFIVGCDSDSVVSRNIEVKNLLQLKENPDIPMRDLTLNKKMDNDDIGITELRQTDCLAEGEAVHIEDITSSKIQIIDDIEKFHKVMQGVQPGFSGKLEELIGPLFLGWSRLDQKKKLKQYSQNTCHELNYFLFKRDRPFYDEVVKPYIQSKMEKSFIDWYLLS